MPPHTVLLVDDTRLFLALEKEFLRQSAVKVLTAENGLEALDIVRTQRPDLIYMDLNMPVMNGAECCAALKADPLLAAIPVILVTTAGRPEDIALCNEAGCDGFLNKPIDRKHFLEIGRRFLESVDRREPRFRCQNKVRFALAGGAAVFGMISDINAHGIYIAVGGGKYQVDDQIDVSFLVSGRSSDLVEARGRIAWTNVGTHRRKPTLAEGFGVEFLSLAGESVKLIMKFIQQNAVRSASTREPAPSSGLGEG